VQSVVLGSLRRQEQGSELVCRGGRICPSVFEHADQLASLLVEPALRRGRDASAPFH
jgi:hypothetical protein